MLNDKDTSMTFSATSIINEEVVARFSASYNAGSGMYFSMSISDQNLYKLNQSIVDADYNNFREDVLAKSTTLTV